MFGLSRFGFSRFAQPRASVTTTPLVNNRKFRYYQLYITAGGADGTSVAMLEMAETLGGVDTTQGQVYSASSIYAFDPTSTADKAFDNNPSTYWGSNFSLSDPPFPAFLRVDYGSDSSNWKAINQIRLSSRNDGAWYQAPTAFELQGSDDGVNWFTLLSQSGQSWSWVSGETRAFMVHIAPPPAAGGGLIKTYLGGQWVDKPVKYWNGSAWVQKPLKFWNGTTWTLS